jgi:alkylated DNA repair dioxygenase AlkB
MANTCSMMLAGPGAHAELPAPSLFDVLPSALDATFATARRFDLGDGAWLDHVPGWVTGTAAVLDDLLAHVPWQHRQTIMYGAVVDEPRLSAWGPRVLDAAPVARPLVAEVRRRLTARYGARFGSAGCNLYRDGGDSVDWHGDRELRDRVGDTFVAVVTFGGRRPFRLRPHGGGPGLTLLPDSGDLLVMGGTCQRTWQHCVPKTARAATRVSVSLRAAPVSAGRGT